MLVDRVELLPAAPELYHNDVAAPIGRPEGPYRAVLRRGAFPVPA